MPANWFLSIPISDRPTVEGGQGVNSGKLSIMAYTRFSTQKKVSFSGWLYYE